MNANDGNIIEVPVAGIEVAKAPDKLSTTLVSSNFVIAVHDSHNKVGGLLHGRFSTIQDGFIKPLLQQLIKEGGQPQHFQAKIIAGSPSLPSAEIIPKDRLALIQQELADRRITVQGACHGNTVEFCTLTGTIDVETKL